MFYSQDVIDEVIERNDIVDVIGSYVRLQKKGANYFGLCPFHNEKSASFCVSAQKQMFYCFGCEESGNVIGFIMKYENQDFKEALQNLAQRGGVNLPEPKYNNEERANIGIRQSILEINKKAAIFYVYQMNHTEDGAKAKKYLTDRGLTEETIKRFGLGYSPLRSTDLYQYLKNSGFTDEQLKLSGLLVYSEKGVFDRFFNRVMFPILDINNHVIGFGGRVMGSGEPKYLNSPETKAFDKSNNLFGLHEARRTREKYMLVCEGYMDVISMHQAGFNHSVASLGTALTPKQAKIIKRYVNEVILTYDSDGAGTKAALRAIPIFREAGVRTKVLNLKPYKDPDEFIKNLGRDAFVERIEQATNSFHFEIHCLQKEYKMEDPEEKNEFYIGIAKKLARFSTELERNTYEESICKEYGIPVKMMRELVVRVTNSPEFAREQERARLLEERSREREWRDAELAEREAAGEHVTAQPTPRPKPKTRGISQAQRLLLAWIAEEPEVYRLVVPFISPEDFNGDLLVRVAKILFEQCRNNNVNPGQIPNLFADNEDEFREVSSLFFSSTKESIEENNREQFLTDTVKRIKQESIERQLKLAASFEDLQRLTKAREEAEHIQIHL